MSDVLTYLQNKGMSLKKAGGWEYNTPCVFCGEDLGSRGRLYINVDPDADVSGLYYCHRCEAKGNLVTLKKHFGDQVADEEMDQNRRAEILHSAAAYYATQLEYYDDVSAYLRGPKRGLTLATLDRHQIGYAPMDFEFDLANNTAIVRRPKFLYRALRSEGFDAGDILATGLCFERDNRIVDSLAGMVTIPYHTTGHVTMIRGRSWPFDDADFKEWTLEPYAPAKAKYKTCGGNATRLYNTDAAWDTEEIYITEGEMDCLVLEQLGYAALGVPGANAWQDAWNGYVAPMKRVFVVFDRDQAGEQGAGKIVEKFGPKVRRIHLSPEGQKCDPTMWFGEGGHTKAEFDALVAEVAGGRLLITVSEAIAEFESIQSQPGIKFGFEMLDLMIEPGLQANQLMIVLAKTGSGKSLLLLNLMHRVRAVHGQEGLKILFVSLEQTRGEWWDRARRIHRFYNLESTEAKAAAWWEDNLLLVDKNRLTEVDLRLVLDDYAYRMGGYPDLMCLDYLGYFARGFKGEAYERTSNAVMCLKGICKDYGIPMIVPHQVSRIGKDGEEFGSDAARDSGVCEETADFLLTVWSPDNALARSEEEKTGQMHLRIGKSRHGGRGVLLNMQWAPVSLVMVPQGDPLCARARQEFMWRQKYRDNWEKAVYRHRTGFEGHLDRVPVIGTRLEDQMELES